MIDYLAVIKHIKSKLITQNIYIIAACEEGVSVYNRYRELYSINCFLSLEMIPSKEEIELAKKAGADVKYWQDVAYHDKNAFYLLCGATSMRYENMLMSIGCRQYEEYIYASYLPIINSDKQKILFAGTCQMESMFEFIKQLEPIKEKYDIYFFATNKLSNRWSSRRLAFLMNICDIYIYTSNDYIGHLPDKITFRYDSPGQYFLREELPKNCKIYCVPNLCSIRLYWPTMILESYNPYYEYFKGSQHWNNRSHSPIYFADAKLDELISSKVDTDMVVEISELDNFVSEGDIESHKRMIYECISHVDDNCDMKIGEYILSNYKKEMLFKDADHIQPTLAKEYIARMMRMIGIECRKELNDIFTDGNIAYEKIQEHCSEVPVYPSVAKKMGLEWCDKERKYICILYRGTEKLTTSEYVKKYCEISERIKSLQEIW